MEHLLLYFENIMENGAFAPIFEDMENGAFARGANAPFSIVFSKVFKVYLIFSCHNFNVV